MENPVSKILLEKITELRDTNKKLLERTFLNSESASKIDFHLLSEIKGCIITLERVLEVKSLLDEYIIQEEIKNVQDSRAENQGQD